GRDQPLLVREVALDDPIDEPDAVLRELDEDAIETRAGTAAVELESVTRVFGSAAALGRLGSVLPARLAAGPHLGGTLDGRWLPAHPEHGDRDQIGDTGDRAEPAVRAAVVPACDLDDERDDERADHREARDRGGVDVDLPEALVTAVTAQPSDR